MSPLDALLETQIVGCQKARVLVVAHTLPRPLYEFGGELAYVGYSPPTSISLSPIFSARVARSEEEVLAALRTLVNARIEPFDVIILDTDHTAATLAAQISAVQPVSTADTLFFFPGAAPPRRGVGSPTPTESWWTGDVWTLRTILDEAGARGLVSDAEPVGFLLAINVPHLDASLATKRASELQTAVEDDAALKRHIHVSSDARIAELVSQALERRVDGSFVQIVVNAAEPDIRKSIAIDDFRAWVRPSPAFVLDLSEDVMDTGRLDQADRSIHGVTFDCFDACHVLGRDVILCGYGKNAVLNCYGRNVYPQVTQANLELLVEEPPLRGDRATLLELRGEALVIPRTLLDEAVPLEEPVFLGTPDEHRNYGMWLLYSVPGVRLYNSHKADFPKFLAFEGSSWQARMLIELGVDPDDLIGQRGECSYRCPGLATMRQSYRSLALADSDLAAFDDFADRAVHGHGQGPERIYVSRLGHTRAGGYRGLQNEPSLIAGLAELGFRAVEPELLSLSEQARLFRNAKVVVGLGGAAMFNVAFSRPGVKVVDIESGTLHVDAHANLFASRGAEYGIIFGQIDQDDPRPVHRRWTVDVDAAVRAIAEFL